MASSKDQTLDTLLNIIDVARPWRPIRILPPIVVGSPIGIGNNPILQLQAQTPPVFTGANPSGKNGIPKPLISVNATESPVKLQSSTVSEVSISFIRDGSDLNYYAVGIWFTGYHGNPNPVLMASGTTSPVSFLCDTTDEVVVVQVQTVSSTGLSAPLIFAKSTTVKLDGVVSAPPAPSIAQSLVGTPTGYQFSFNQDSLAKGDEDVINAYRVYRSATNLFATATLRTTIAPDATALGAITFTDTINDALATNYFYWVTAVNTVGLESVPTPAQSGAIVGSIGSIPATLNTPFKISSTTTSTTFSTSPSAFFTRSDGTTTLIGTTSTAVTGLVTNNQSFYYPYWDEVTQTLKYVMASDVAIPNITGITCVAASSQWIQTTTSGAIPTAFACEVWMKGIVAANQVLFSYSAPQGSGTLTGKVMQAFVTSTGNVEMAIWNSSAWTTVTTAGASVLDGEWHHVVCSYTSGTISIYVDGLNTSDNITFWNNASAGVIITTAGFWHIGFAAGVTGAPLTVNTFNSLSLSHAAIYPSYFTVIQAGAHAQAFTNLGESMYALEIAYDSASNYWQLEETSGTTAADSIGTNTGTYIGSPTLNQTSPVITVIGTPQIAWPFVSLGALQQQYLRNRTPLSSSAIASSTTSTGTSTGTGGGSSGGFGGGGRGGCFTAATMVKTQDGNKSIAEVKRGDLVLTARNTWRPVIALIKHEAEPRTLHVIPGGVSTHNHKILLDGQWVCAGKIYTETVEANEPVYTLTVGSTEPEVNAMSPRTEHSFTLSSGLVVTNQMIQKELTA